MARTIGLFGNDADATAASDALHAAGFGDEMEVINRDRAMDEFPGDLAVSGTSGEPVGVLGDKDEPKPETLTQGNVAEYLFTFGLEGEEALFYADRIQGGSTLIIVDAGEDMTDKAADLMKQSGGRVDVF